MAEDDAQRQHSDNSMTILAPNAKASVITKSGWLSHWMRTNSSSIHFECMGEDHISKSREMQVQIAKALKNTTPSAQDKDRSSLSKFDNMQMCEQKHLPTRSASLQVSEELKTETREMGLRDETRMKKTNQRNFLNDKLTHFDKLSFLKFSGSKPKFLSPSLKNMNLEEHPSIAINFNRRLQNNSIPIVDLGFCQMHESTSQSDYRCGGENAAPNKNETLLSKDIFKCSSEDAHSRDEQKRARRLPVKNTVPSLKPFHDINKGFMTENATRDPSPKLFSCCYDKEKIDPPILKGKENTPNNDIICVDNESFNLHSSFLVSNKKLKKVSACDDGDASLDTKIGHFPLYSHSSLSGSHVLHVGPRNKRIDICSYTDYGRNLNDTQEVRQEEMACDVHFDEKMPACSLQGAETLKIYPNSCPAQVNLLDLNASNDINHWLVAKNHEKNGTNVKEKCMEKKPWKIESSVPNFCYNCKRGTLLQSQIDTTSNNDNKTTYGPLMTASMGTPNESSTETDTMYLDNSHAENSPKGSDPKHFHKELVLSPHPLKILRPLAIIDSNIKGGNKNTDNKLPDMNKEASPCLPTPPYFDNVEASTSRTESLDVDHFLSDIEKTVYANSNPPNSQGLDPSSISAKRLKMGASDIHRFCNMLTKDAFESSNGHLAHPFQRLLNYQRTKSEQLNGKSISQDLEKKCHDLILSHPWIRRWCHDQDSETQIKPQSGSGETSAPEISRAALKEFQKKQFPTIAAMALMGKTVSNLMPCKIMKRGPFIVWDADDS